MDKISVIVPIYKVEQYLERCVRSICRQTYTNLEILLVDDGSPDRCGEMCDAFAKLDPRITVIHKPNGGLSDARNVGMDRATGDYIAFIDSDDWFDPTMLEVLHNLCIEHDADIAECNCRSHYHENVTIFPDGDGKIVELTPVEALNAELDFSYCKPMAWNKLYRREITKGIYYPVGRLHEDEFTTHKFYLAARKIVYIDMAFYNYERKNLGSITASFKIRNLHSYDAFRERLHLIWSRPDLSELDQKMCDVYSWVLFDLLRRCKEFKVVGPEVDEMIDHALEDYPQLVEHGVSPHYIGLYEDLKVQREQDKRFASAGRN